ncbi:MAG: hypothetical protein JW706_08580 [Opitutales bacterium]|nr:hypothetical protein [Opitutales bacterium]
MWIEILFIVGAVLTVWLSSLTHRVPQPREIQGLDVDSELKREADRIINALCALGFLENGYYDCSMTNGQKAQLYLMIHEDRSVEFAIMFFRVEDQHSSYVWEFSTSLLPHGELCTNTNNNYDSTFHPMDHFVLKMPWVNKIEDLYYAHLLHMRQLLDNGFSPCEVSVENTKHRIVDQVRWSYDLQVQKGRMKRMSDGSYKLTLYGSALGVPMLLFSMLHPILRVFVGKRKDSERIRYINRMAINAHNVSLRKGAFGRDDTFGL